MIDFDMVDRAITIKVALDLAKKTYDEIVETCDIRTKAYDDIMKDLAAMLKDNNIGDIIVRNFIVENNNGMINISKLSRVDDRRVRYFE